MFYPRNLNLSLLALLGGNLLGVACLQLLAAPAQAAKLADLSNWKIGAACEAPKPPAGGGGGSGGSTSTPGVTTPTTLPGGGSAIPGGGTTPTVNPALLINSQIQQQGALQFQGVNQVLNTLASPPQTLQTPSGESANRAQQVNRELGSAARETRNPANGLSNSLRAIQFSPNIVILLGEGSEDGDALVVEAPGGEKPKPSNQRARSGEGSRSGNTARSGEGSRSREGSNRSTGATTARARTPEGPKPAPAARTPEGPKPAAGARTPEGPKPAPAARTPEGPKPAAGARTPEGPKPARIQPGGGTSGRAPTVAGTGTSRNQNSATGSTTAARTSGPAATGTGTSGTSGVTGTNPDLAPGGSSQEIAGVGSQPEGDRSNTGPAPEDDNNTVLLINRTITGNTTLVQTDQQLLYPNQVLLNVGPNGSLQSVSGR